MQKHYTPENQFIALVNLLIFTISPFALFAKEDIKPSIEPVLFTYNTEITVTYDVTGNTLANLSKAWIWVWIPDKNIVAKYNVNPASDNASLTDNAKFSKSTDNDKTLFKITFTPMDFFEGDISSESKMGILLKGNDWTDGQTTDYIADLSEDKFTVVLIKPKFDPVFINTNEALDIEAFATELSKFRLSINNVEVNVQSDVTGYMYPHTVMETEGIVPCTLNVSSAISMEDTTINFNYIIRTSTIDKPRPAGIISGINYHDDDETKVTLCLLAPMKSSIFVLGEFNDFTISPTYQMFKDGAYFWLEIEGLVPGQEYAFQYLVDEEVYVADPFADKILDPDDKWIPAAIYPNLKTYPEIALKNAWYFNRLAIFQTGQMAYSWKNDNYSKPEKENLIIYELLVRDFFDEQNRSYNNLIDTITYFKSLGVNAIELMPIQEFNGNSSWGYNPTFMFAPDKAYGTKNKLKEFIDVAHENGIAVILDVVFNHQDVPNPYASMYFDFSPENFKPKPENPWFNVDATHPFSVFSDMNHESNYTKHYMDTTLHYWINEYHVDGFRFDLSKGFTQTVSGSDVSKWGQKDQSRIDIITRMADKVWSYSPDTWLMLEHFADNSEEFILSEHGLILWGNMHGAYKEAILGYHENGKSNLELAYAPERAWNNLNLLTYMESHDEERQMFDALEFGNSDNGYDVKEKETALDRIKAASAFLYTIPGPKMFWQFGELGYDISIEENGRTGEKPVLWSYFNDIEREKLHDLKAELIKFRLENNIFKNGDFVWSPENEVKRIEMSDDQMKMLIIGNFGVTNSVVSGNFPAAGIWYDFFTGDSFEITYTNWEMQFEPGEFHIYTTKKIEGIKSDLVPWGSNFIITGLEDNLSPDIIVFPNPSSGKLIVQNIPSGNYRLQIIDITGQVLQNKTVFFNSTFETNIADFPIGFYHLLLSGNNGQYRFKFIKN